MPQFKSSASHYVLSTSTGALNVTGDGTDYTVKFDTKIADADGEYNSSTGVFTAKMAGLRHFAWNITLRDIGSGDGFTLAWTTLVATGGTFKMDAHFAASAQAGGSYLTLKGVVSVFMNVGDTAHIEAVVYGGAKTAGVYATAAFNTLSIHLVR